MQGSTVLHHTAQYGDVETASMVASARFKGINPSVLGSKGRTAMQVLEQRPVIEEGLDKAFQRLLESIGEAPL
jgi:hypothetical protein